MAADRRLEDLDLALYATGHAAAVVLAQFGTDLEVRHKSPGQPVTQADTDADRILRDTLTGGRPDYGWLSEETADRPDRLARRRVWIVDPVDGTRSFVEGEPEFALSVALAEDGVAVVGVVCNPAAGALYWAVRGAGAFTARLEDGRPDAVRRLAVREPADGPLTVLASRHEMEYGEFQPFVTLGWQLAPSGSTAYKLARLAAGEGDVFLSRGPKSEWDLCAGGLLVEEAGGRVSDLRGEALQYNRQDPAVYGVLATAHGHESVLELIRTLPESPRMAPFAPVAGDDETDRETNGE